MAFYSLSEAEQHIMDYMWAHADQEEIHLNEIMEYMETKGYVWKQQTAYSFVIRLKNKKILSSTKRGKRRYYSVNMSRKEFIAKGVQEYLNLAYDGSLLVFLRSLEGDHGLSEEHKQELQQFVKEQETEAGRKQRKNRVTGNRIISKKRKMIKQKMQVFLSDDESTCIFLFSFNRNSISDFISVEKSPTSASGEQQTFTDQRTSLFHVSFFFGAVPEESVLDLPQVRLERYFPDSHMEPVLFLVNKMAVGKHFRNGQIPSHDHMDHLFPDNFARHIPVWH